MITLKFISPAGEELFQGVAHAIPREGETVIVDGVPHAVQAVGWNFDTTSSGPLAAVGDVAVIIRKLEKP